VDRRVQSKLFSTVSFASPSAILLRRSQQRTEADYISKLKDFEGFTDFMYLDSRGNVTIGVGILSYGF